MKRKSKSEPSLLAQLSKPLRDFVDDITANGADALRAVRERDPAKYLELSTKLLPLIVALNPEAPSALSDCQSSADIGARMLQSLGCSEPTEAQIQAAIKANDMFIAELEAIRAKAEGELN
jgi:hypothetical protein